MASQFLVLTAQGPDRPGLVDRLSEFVFSRGGNVEASRMATLGGDFAIIMLVSGPDEAAGRIMNEADTLVHTAQLMCTVRPTSPPQEHTAIPEALPYGLEVYSMDHPGILQPIAHHLAEQGVNIEQLDTTVDSAPHTGTALFHLQARLAVPAGVNLKQFRADLTALAERLNVDIRLGPAD